MRFLPVRLLIGFLLIVAPYTALIGFNDNLERLRTWRIVAALLFVLVPLACRWRLPPSAKLLLGSLVAFSTYLCLQPSLFGRPAEAMDIAFIGSVVIVTSLMLLAVLLAVNDRAFTLHCLSLSLALACLYQYWQLFAWHFLSREWVSILNDRTQVDLIGFYREIAGLFGAPSFMGEAGQLALYIGPGAGILFLARHYKLYPTSRVILGMVVVSLAATLSIGGVVNLTMLLAIYTLIIFGSGIRLSKRVLWLGSTALLLGGLVAVELLNPDILQFFGLRWESIASGTSERQLGATMFLELLQSSPWFGYGFMSYLAIDAQPSHFITILTDHGIVGSLLLGTVCLLPLTSILWRSKYRLFAIPYVASLLHVALAYGSYQWPGLWINLGLALYFMEVGRIRPSSMRRAESHRVAYGAVTAIRDR